VYFNNVLLLYYFNNIGLQVSPTYKSQGRRFSHIDRYIPFNMILMDLNFFYAILYNTEIWSMWKIYSVPCNSSLNKFHCIILYLFILFLSPADLEIRTDLKILTFILGHIFLLVLQFLYMTYLVCSLTCHNNNTISVREIKDYTHLVRTHVT
jgi:hypothetical protein